VAPLVSLLVPCMMNVCIDGQNWNELKMILEYILSAEYSFTSVSKCKYMERVV